jgi:lipopolysaccharide transport system ATP-binding protein
VLLDRGRPLLTGDPRTAVTLYQQLLYAPAGREDEIRARILAEARAPGSFEAERLSQVAHAAPPGADVELDDPAWLDPALQSSSVLRYEVNGAEIRDPVLLTRSGARVNCLTANERYVLRYEVRFEKDAFDVRYHTLVKAVSGFELGGGTHPEVGVLGRDVPAGAHVRVEFEFRCSLNPGVYFLNCGVTGSGGQQLHRIVDALAFRVLPIAGATTFGHVNFAHRARVAGED